MNRCLRHVPIADIADAVAIGVVIHIRFNLDGSSNAHQRLGRPAECVEFRPARRTVGIIGHVLQTGGVIVVISRVGVALYIIHFVLQNAAAEIEMGDTLADDRSVRTGAVVRDRPEQSIVGGARRSSVGISDIHHRHSCTVGVHVRRGQRQFMSLVSPVGKTAAQVRGLRNALTGAELAQKDARGQRVSPLGVEAADEIRTHDVQLGKRTCRSLSLCKDKWLRRGNTLGDQLGASGSRGLRPGVHVPFYLRRRPRMG